jgi:hypothetical protein
MERITNHMHEGKEGSEHRHIERRHSIVFGRIGAHRSQRLIAHAVIHRRPRLHPGS